MPNRRRILASGVALASAASLPASAAEKNSAARAEQPGPADGKPSDAVSSGELISGQAEHVISIWLGGGMGQIDTFDPKRRGDPKAKKPGAYYDAVDTSVPGVQVCEHLAGVAREMEHVTAVRTVHHDVIDEHAAATNRMHTGRNISGTVTYPSLGSLVAHERGAVSPEVPPYVLIGYPNVTRGPGFLGSRDGYLYLTSTDEGPAGLSRPEGITQNRQSRRGQYLAQLLSMAGETNGATRADYRDTIRQSLRLSGPEFNQVFQLDREPDALLNRYGGEFGRRCLLSRRLVQRGVRFVEVSHNLNFLNGAGWDVHNEGIVNQHELIREMDSAVATLIDDLRRTGMLDKTVIVITTEFGRPPEFDSGGGRGHQGSAFTCVLAGGGLKHCGAYGQTDDLAKKIVSDPVGVPDFFATIFAALGIDYTKSLMDGDRPVPICDQGQPIRSLFA
ncbi:DUF1501 domain-containing protein [Roseiconus nitratireducens]|uniref:DUF1501 domain-containing protein n=1 Tax=Roseiconus nitratireducens TaxID=2605748 RepID=UPI0036F23554